MSEWKFKVTYNGKEYIVSFRENEKLDAYARIENIVSKFEGAEYERIYGNE